jgi:predicted nucleotidyltransferase
VAAILDQPALERFCRRYHVVRLSLFGSVVRGELRAQSDLDFLVEYEAGHRPGLVALQQIEDDLS